MVSDELVEHFRGPRPVLKPPSNDGGMPNQSVNHDYPSAAPSEHPVPMMADWFDSNDSHLHVVSIGGAGPRGGRARR